MAIKWRLTSWKTWISNTLGLCNVELYMFHTILCLIPYSAHAKLLLNSYNEHVKFRLEPQNRVLKSHLIWIVILLVQPADAMTGTKWPIISYISDFGAKNLGPIPILIPRFQTLCKTLFFFALGDTFCLTFFSLCIFNGFSIIFIPHFVP